MRRVIIPVFGALALAILLHASAARAATTWRGWDDGLRVAGSAGRPVLVDVYTDWCGWCKRMDRDVYSRSDVQNYLSRRFVTIKLNAESGVAARYEGKPFTSRSLAARFGVNSYPTSIFLNAKGGHLGNVPGYLPPEKFLQLLRYIGDGHMERGESFEDYSRRAGGSPPAPGRAGR